MIFARVSIATGIKNLGFIKTYKFGILLEVFKHLV